MVGEKIQNAINKQIQEEMFSSYLYLSMSTYLESINLSGFAHWLRLHAQEEMFHGMKLYYYLIERGGRVELMTLQDPQKEWASVKEVFDAALNHEYHITKCINDLMDLAIEERDHASKNVLNWFVDEQVEEEDKFSGIVDQLAMIGENSGMLFMMNKEMGARVPGANPYVPAPEGE